MSSSRWRLPSLIFALRGGAESTALLFLLALGMTIGLVILQRLTVWLIARAGTTG